MYACNKNYILHKVSQPPEPACKSGTSPQVQNQSASPEPVRNQSGNSHHTHPIFQPIEKKNIKIYPSPFEKWLGRIVRKSVRKLVSRLVHPFADYDQSGLSVFQTSVDPRYGFLQAGGDKFVQTPGESLGIFCKLVQACQLPTTLTN